MSEMIERVESAISEACGYALPPFLLEKCARAAIEAMREPTEEMIRAFYKENYGSATEGWYDMIDAAIAKEKADTP